MIQKITHITLLVKNQDEALEFYTKKLGFKLHTDAKCPDSGMRWLTIAPAEQPDVEIALMQVTEKDDLARVGKQAGSFGIGCLLTKDCHKTYKELKSKGVEFIGEPKTEQWGTGVTLKDLYGNMWYINSEPTQPSR